VKRQNGSVRTDYLFEMFFTLVSLDLVDHFNTNVDLLGFTLDSKLTWNGHIDKLCKRLARTLYLLRKLKHNVSLDCMLMAYFAFFNSHITYGIKLWGHASSVKRILILQKKSLRILAGVGLLEHCKPFFKQFGILTVINLYIYTCICSIKSNIHEFCTVSSRNPYVTRNRAELDVPRLRLSKAANCYPTTGLKMFNRLPDSLKDLPERQFKVKLKNYLLNHPFYSADEFSDKAKDFK